MVDSRFKLALFFTFGMSVKGWSEAGIVHRDCLLYKHLADLGCDILFVTYGGADDEDFVPAGVPVRVLSKPSGMSNRRYGWTIPFLHRERLRDVDVIKSHQISGARFAAWSKYVLGKPYIARCGYLPSVFAREGRRPWREREQIWREECLAFHAANAVSVPSQAEIDYVAGRYRAGRAKAHACPNWVDPDSIRLGWC